MIRLQYKPVSFYGAQLNMMLNRYLLKIREVCEGMKVYVSFLQLKFITWLFSQNLQTVLLRDSTPSLQGKSDKYLSSDLYYETILLFHLISLIYFHLNSSIQVIYNNKHLNLVTLNEDWKT